MEKLRQPSVWLHLPVSCLAYCAPDKPPAQVCSIPTIRRSWVPSSTATNLQGLERQTLVRSLEDPGAPGSLSPLPLHHSALSSAYTSEASALSKNRHAQASNLGQARERE